MRFISSWRVGAFIGAVLIITFFAGIGIGLHFASIDQSSISGQDFDQYCLFTWKTRSGEISFALMRQFESARFIHAWTSKWGAKHGIARLKEALGALPSGAHVSWNTWPPKDCYYPEDNVVKEIVDFAKAKGVSLDLTPTLE